MRLSTQIKKILLLLLKWKTEPPNSQIKHAGATIEDIAKALYGESALESAYDKRSITPPEELLAEAKKGDRLAMMALEARASWGVDREKKLKEKRLKDSIRVSIGRSLRTICNNKPPLIEIGYKKRAFYTLTEDGVRIAKGIRDEIKAFIDEFQPLLD